MIWRCRPASARAPSAGLTGAVPYGRVSCPTPALISVAQGAAELTDSC